MFSFPCVAFLFDSVGMGNIIVLFLVILIVVGPKRLPEVARKLGRMMETFRRAADEFKTQIMTIDQEPPKEQTSSQSDTPTDKDGVPQSTSSGDEEPYKNPYEVSPYPGNEQYAAGWNAQESRLETEATPPATEQPASEEAPPTPQPEATVEPPPESERAP